MATEALTINLTPPTATGGIGFRLGLDQDPVDNGRLSLADLQQMVSRARSGLSARTWQPSGCAARISANEVVVETAVRVWPSANFPYVLTAALGEFAAAVEVRIEREFDLLVAHTDTAELPYQCSDVTTTWQTPCFNRFGEEIERPAITTMPSWLELDGECWGVLRVRALAHGYRHPLTVRFPRVLGSRITDVKNHATATWEDASGPRAEGIDLRLPACVSELLAACAGGLPRIDIDVTEDEPGVPTVYYSTCTGEVILVRYE